MSKTKRSGIDFERLVYNGHVGLREIRHLVRAYARPDLYTHVFAANEGSTFAIDRPENNRRHAIRGVINARRQFRMNTAGFCTRARYYTSVQTVLVNRCVDIIRVVRDGVRTDTFV